MVGQVGVYDAGGGVCAHVEAAHGVVGVEHLGWGVGLDGGGPGGGGEVEGGELAAEDAGEAESGILLSGVDAPVYDGAGQAESVKLLGKADAVVRVGSLLNVNVEDDAGTAGDGAAPFEAGREEEAGYIAQAAEDGQEILSDGLLELAGLNGTEQVADGGCARVLWLLNDDVGHDGEELLAGAGFG